MTRNAYGRQNCGVKQNITLSFYLFNFFTNPENRGIRPTTFDAQAAPIEWFKTDKRERLLAKMRLAMLVHGIDLKGWRGGIVSSAHTQADVDLTLNAWQRSLRALKEEGDLPQSAEAALAQ